jgi:Fe-S cluster assembly ATP-binding protein
MIALKPKLAILDEPDSGLDIDALKKIAQAINKAHKAGMAILLITHYQRILKYLKPDKVHIMVQGNIKKSGGRELVKMIEKKGYENIK